MENDILHVSGLRFVTRTIEKTSFQACIALNAYYHLLPEPDVLEKESKSNFL